MNKKERNFIISIIISITLIFLIILKILVNIINKNKNIIPSKINKSISVNINHNKDEDIPPLKRMPINIPTRGETQYIQIGILSNPENNKILPLYGKQTYQTSQMWNYYTTTDTYNLIKIPLNYESKDCMKEQGCRELNNGDTIVIDEYGETFTIKIYETKEYRYIPYN
jgi:hypothetical protein|tara:strand:+ start:420 stop:926 length:507 start_codon:yes stop_codon:yes gene_type:complete